MDNLTELYCHIDDFCKLHQHYITQHAIANKSKSSKKKRNRPCRISLAEIITLLVLFHQIRYREFKAFYYDYVCRWLKKEFPQLPSYSRLLELIPRVISPMQDYLKVLMANNCTGISFIDSTKLAVCDNRRIERHQVFTPYASRGKTSMGWFYGFKLHAIINDKGELVNVCLTSGNIDDRKPVEYLCNVVHGKLYGDKGYISQPLANKLAKDKDIIFITRHKKNMKSKISEVIDKRLLKRRALVETVFDELKNLCQIEHTRHRTINGFLSNLLGGLIAYCWQPNKPSLKNVLLECHPLQVA